MFFTFKLYLDLNCVLILIEMFEIELSLHKNGFGVK